MKNDKNKIWTPLLFLLFILIGASFAFFESSLEDEKALSMQIHAESVKYLNFDFDKSITLHADTTTFTQDGNNISDTIAGSVKLMAYHANGESNTVSYNYDVYFNVLENDFIYTQDNTKPELILNVYGPDGELKDDDIAGLTYHTKDSENPNDISGYDVTRAQSRIPIKLNQNISTDNYIEKNWTFTLTLVNLSTNQFNNNGHHIKAEIIAQQVAD